MACCRQRGCCGRGVNLCRWGIADIADGEFEVEVTFASALNNADYVVVVTIENQTDLSPSAYSIVITDKTPNGFTALLSAPTLTANYKMNWFVE